MEEMKKSQMFRFVQFSVMKDGFMSDKFKLMALRELFKLEDLELFKESQEAKEE